MGRMYKGALGMTSNGAWCFIEGAQIQVLGVVGDRLSIIEAFSGFSRERGNCLKDTIFVQCRRNPSLRRQILNRTRAVSTQPAPNHDMTEYLPFEGLILLLRMLMIVL